MLYHSQATERIVRDDLDTGLQGVSDPFTLSDNVGKLRPVPRIQPNRGLVCIRCN